MSEFAQRMQRLRWLREHYEIHDLTDYKVMLAYYNVTIWIYAAAIIGGNYQ